MSESDKMNSYCALRKLPVIVAALNIWWLSKTRVMDSGAAGFLCKAGRQD